MSAGAGDQQEPAEPPRGGPRSPTGVEGEKEDAEGKNESKKREADAETAVAVYSPKKRRRLHPHGPAGGKAAAGGAAGGTTGRGRGRGAASSSSAAPAPEAPLPGSGDWLAGSRGHYDVLGIARNADLPAIRRAYRRQALRTHPDKGGDTKDFLRVIGAFEVLSDRSRREAYDLELDGQGCRDGQSAQAGADEPEAPEDQPLLKEVLVGARIALVKLFDAEPEDWSGLLAELSTAVLEALAGLPQLQGSGRNPGYRARNEEDDRDFPREIQPPEDLPRDWKCMEYMYQTGKSAGLTYIRYQSPWGRKKFQSIAEAIKADAEWRNLDASHTAAKLAKRRRDKQPESGQRLTGTQRPVQRGIYTVRNAANVSKYWVNVNWQYFRVYTRRTTSLAEAVDWHIALSNAKEVAQARMRAQLGRGGVPTPMTRNEQIEMLTSEPGLRLMFSSNFSKGGVHNIYTPSTEDLDTAVLIHQRFHRLLEGRFSSASINEERRKACTEVSAKIKELTVLQRKLKEAVSRELGRRQRTIGMELPAPAGAASPEKLPAPKRPEPASSCGGEPLQAGGSSSSCSALAPPEPETGYKASSSSGSRARCGPSGEALAPLAPSRGGRRPPIDRRSPMQVALELQAALGLDRKEATALAQAARALPPGDVKRRLAELLEVTGRAASRLRQRRGRLTGGVRGRSRGRSREPHRLALRGPSPARTLHALPAPSGEQLALAAPGDAAGRPEDPLVVSWCFLGLPAGITPVPWLDLLELCRFRGGCRGACYAAGTEFKERFRNFRYAPGFLEPSPHITRSGRPIVTFSNGCAAERGLVRFLAKPHHAKVFEQLDLSLAPMRALENQWLRDALGGMPNLRHVVIPWHGWSTSVARRCFLRALPPRASFESIDSRGSVMTRGAGGE